MQWFLIAAGCLWIAIGAAIVSDAKSAIHEILACLLFSFGVLFWAFAAIMRAWKQGRAPDKTKFAVQSKPAPVRPPTLPNRLENQ